MTSPDLTGLSEGQVVTGVRLTTDQAAALNRSGLVTAQPDEDDWRVTAAYAVGAVRRGDLVVRVRPKVGVVQVLRLLARARGLRGLALDASRVDDADLSAVLAVLFAAEAATALAAGPLRGYRTEDQSLPVLRGRIRLREQHLRRFALPSPVEVTVDEWTLDTDENRLLRAAAHRLLALTDVPASARQGLLRLDRALTEARPLSRGAAAPSWTPSRLNVRLHALLRLADLVLAHTSVEHAAGNVRTHGFVIDMAWLFETLVARILGEHCPGLRTQQSMPLDTLGRLTIRPDLVVHGPSGPVAVADTKYKLLDDEGTLTNADAYQLVTYAGRLGLRTGHLVYASGEPHPEPFDVVGADVRLVVHAVSIAAPIKQIEAQVAELVDHLVGREVATHRTDGLRETSRSSTS